MNCHGWIRGDEVRATTQGWFLRERGFARGSPVANLDVSGLFTRGIANPHCGRLQNVWPRS